MTKEAVPIVFVKATTVTVRLLGIPIVSFENKPTPPRPAPQTRPRNTDSIDCPVCSKRHLDGFCRYKVTQTVAVQTFYKIDGGNPGAGHKEE
jgi:hypothetical protein